MKRSIAFWGKKDNGERFTATKSEMEGLPGNHSRSRFLPDLDGFRRSLVLVACACGPLSNSLPGSPGQRSPPCFLVAAEKIAGPVVGVDCLAGGGNGTVGMEKSVR